MEIIFNSIEALNIVVEGVQYDKATASDKE